MRAFGSFLISVRVAHLTSRATTSSLLEEAGHTVGRARGALRRREEAIRL